MSLILSSNTKAILLLTAPLIAGPGVSSSDRLSPGEYKRLARRLRDMRRQPADLMSSNARDLLRACESVVDEVRLQHLLGRGFLLSQAIERWQSRAIWVVSRADSDYPKRLKTRLREDSPPVIYGCGDIGVAETGGLAVVGSRRVDDELVEYTLTVGRLAALAGRTIISGGAKGIDRSAMRGAIEAGGKVIGVLADSLESTALNRENRNLIIDGRLVLLSPYDPSAGFNVGNAMQRNKLIYALADVALVVSTDLNKGGTWSGATQQLKKLRLVPIYVRSTGPGSAGLDALKGMGAVLWPNPSDANEFAGVFKRGIAVSERETPVDIDLFSYDLTPVKTTRRGRVSAKRQQGFDCSPNAASQNESDSKPKAKDRVVKKKRDPIADVPVEQGKPRDSSGAVLTSDVADKLFATVRQTMRELLTVPMKEADVAAALEVSVVQVRTWIGRLVNERVLEKLKKPIRYVATSNSELFNQ